MRASSRRERGAHRATRGRIGTQLLRAVESLAGPGVATYALFTGADSADNVRLYERLGYRQIRREALPKGPGLVHLEKPAHAQRPGITP